MEGIQYIYPASRPAESHFSLKSKGQGAIPVHFCVRSQVMQVRDKQRATFYYRRRACVWLSNDGWNLRHNRHKDGLSGVDKAESDLSCHRSSA